MTWSYSGDPSASDTDEVRFLVGDTDTNAQLVSNEEIDWALAEYPKTQLAAAVIAESISAKYTRRADSRAGAVSVQWGQIAESFRALAAQLRAQVSTLARPFFGGLTISGKEALANDTDAVQPSFSIGQDDYPGTSNRGDGYE